MAEYMTMFSSWWQSSQKDYLKFKKKEDGNKSSQFCQEVVALHG